MTQTVWANNPFLQKRIVELHDAGLSHGIIAERIGREFPEVFPPSAPPTRDAVKNAVSRARGRDFTGDGEEYQPSEDMVRGDFIGLRTLYVDIEATDLGAAFGHILCCSFADEYGNVETYRIDDPRFAGRNIIDDGPLAIAIRNKMETVDVVVGHNFKLYDKPFINARLMLSKDPRPINSGLKIIDSLYLAGGQNMRLGSRRLETIAKYLKLPVQKTPLDGEVWQLAGAGDKEALNLVVEHCEHDVLVERLAFGRMKGFVSVIHR